MHPFFVLFFEFYRVASLQKLRFSLSEKNDREKEAGGGKVNQTECGSLKIFPRVKKCIFVFIYIFLWFYYTIII